MRENLKLDKTLSRQRLLQSCLLKSQNIKTKQNRKKTYQNNEFITLNVLINFFNGMNFDIYLKRGQNRKIINETLSLSWVNKRMWLL